MRNRNRRWLVAWTLTSLFPYIMLYEIATEYTDNSSGSKDIRGILAPRMNYEQWIPLGRGDPLKNDPTYDYVPPVLDRVHYWIDPASRKPDSSLPGESQKTEILVLGVSSKKPSTGTSIVADSRKDSYSPFLKFVEGPKFGIQNNYQRMSRPHYLMSSYYPSPVFESSDKHSEMYFKNGDPPLPYTVLMPPPLPLKRPEIISFQQALNSLTTPEYITTTTINPLIRDTSSFTIQQANLLYHASTLGNQDEFREKHQFGSIGAPSSQVTWRTPLAIQSDSATDFVKTHQIQRPQLVKNHSNLKNQSNNSNTTVKPTMKELTTLIRNNSQTMHKGQVSDGDLDISNTYVNIGKPEAQMHSPTDMEISSVSVKPPHLTFRQPSILSSPSTSASVMSNPSTTLYSPSAFKPHITPMTLQTLQSMQTMKAPPVSQSPKFTMKITNSIQNLLKNEVTPNFLPTPFTKMPSDLITTGKISEEETISTVIPPITSTVTSLTTDPLFKHYKQPTEPLKGPLYLIIQGHSKVKTYGPGKQIHGITVQETNEIPTSDDKDEYTVKHLHNYKKDSNEGRLRQGRSSKLQTLTHVVKTGLGAIEFSEPVTVHRKDDDVQEMDLVVKYDVSSHSNAVGERYYKGIVEAGDVGRKLKDQSSEM